MMRLAILPLLVVAACGYHLEGTETNVPAGAHTVSVHFRNHTRERGLDVRLRRAVEDEIRRHGAVSVVESGGDVTLDGDIRRFQAVPVAFSANDEAVQYQGVMTVRFRLVERATGRVVFDSPLLQETQDFGAVQGVVVASSPHFQRGTMDARDLASMSNIPLGLARGHQAQHDLIDVIARDIYQQAVEGF
jgi:lipopolysaccharide assembly LptE-like protein